MKYDRTCRRFGEIALVALFLLAGTGTPSALAQDHPFDVFRYPQHDSSRAVPEVVDPGTPSTQQQPGQPPSDAVVLSDLSVWESVQGGEAPWNEGDGYFETVEGAGYIQTKEAFGDVQLHIEWAAPATVVGESQGRGNSGLFFGGGRYEVQILDSYDNWTYPDGQASAIYGQYPPLVNAMNPPGTWNTYDVIFRRPRFDADGSVITPATITVFHNGVLTQDHRELVGPTAYRQRPPYEVHDAEQPIQLQDHGNPVRFRNIWVRELE